MTEAHLARITMKAWQDDQQAQSATDTPDKAQTVLSKAYKGLEATRDDMMDVIKLGWALWTVPPKGMKRLKHGTYYVAKGLQHWSGIPHTI